MVIERQISCIVLNKQIIIIMKSYIVIHENFYSRIVDSLICASIILEIA